MEFDVKFRLLLGMRLMGVTPSRKEDVNKFVE